MYQEVLCPNCGNNTANIVIDMLYCFSCTYVESVTPDDDDTCHPYDYPGSCGCEDYPCCGH